MILHGKDIVFEKDDWWDVSEKNKEDNCQISYKCKLVDKIQSEKTIIGMIKVWCHDDLNKNVVLKNKDDFQKMHDDNDHAYYSIGSDTYYDNLRSFFGNDYKEILRYFNDISLIMDEVNESCLYNNRNYFYKSDTSKLLEEKTKAELKDIKKKSSDEELSLIKNFSKNLEKIYEDEKSIINSYSSDEINMFKYLMNDENIIDKAITLQEEFDNLNEIRDFLYEKKELNYSIFTLHLKMHSFLEKLNDEDLYYKELEETSYFSKIIYDEKNNSDKTNNIIMKMHRKDNVTYVFNQMKNREKNKIKEIMDSNDGLYQINACRTNETLISFFDLFTEAHTPSIRRTSDIGKPLYYPCDMPEQVMYIGEKIDSCKFNAEIQKRKNSTVNSKDNKIVYDGEYDYRRKNLFNEIKFNENNGLKNELNKMRESDRKILIDSLKKTIRYKSYKCFLNDFFENIGKEIDKSIFFDVVSKKEMLFILKVCSFVSRNMFLIIFNDISSTALKIITNIAQKKNFICLYVKEHSSSNDHLKETQSYKELPKMSNYLKIEESEVSGS